MSALTVVAAGIGTTIQDMGRPGFAHLGIPRAGAVDPQLAGLLNRLVGNQPRAALIETCGGFVVRADEPVLVATSHEVAPVSLRAGDTLFVESGHGRVWHYLAVRGGVGVAPVLGSRSTDTLSGLGPPPVATGDLLPIGPDPATPVVTDQAPIVSGGSVARLSPGPRLDWFDTASYERLRSHALTVTASSRVGVRLTGVHIERRVADELPSEGLVRGAIQVPPDSNPVMMLVDHPTTGGYPVIAVVHPDDVTIVANTAAGEQVHFRT